MPAGQAQTRLRHLDPPRQSSLVRQEDPGGPGVGPTTQFPLTMLRVPAGQAQTELTQIDPPPHPGPPSAPQTAPMGSGEAEVRQSAPESEQGQLPSSDDRPTDLHARFQEGMCRRRFGTPIRRHK